MTPSYRLVVRFGGKQQSGTAWYVTPNLVATAFHVVGDCDEAKWIHQYFDAVSYCLEGDPEIRLKARSFDPQSDVALLRSEVDSEEWLPLAEVVPRGERWLAVGYPGFHECKAFTLSGTVTQVYEYVSGRAVQLLVEQKTDVDWSGVSGSPVVVGGRAAGLLTEVTRGATTAWGAPASAVSRLVRAVEIGDEILRLIPTFCDESRADRWQAQISEAPERDLVRLLDFLAREYPEAIGLTQLAEKAQTLSQKAPKSEIPLKTMLELGEQYGIVREVDAGRRPKPRPRREFKKVFERNRGFGGRTDELARLDRFIAQPGGYFFISGLAGFGKTSLLARWVESISARGLNPVFHFLTPDVAEKLEAGTTLKSLCEQLMSFYGLGGDLRLSWSKLQDCYADLLRLQPPKGVPLVVILDGLDEALSLWKPTDEMFPKDLPSGVHVVFSARSMAKNWLRDLGLELNDLQILQLGQLNRDEVREALTHSGVVTTPELEERVFKVTEGDPFYVTDVVRHLKQPGCDPASIESLPKGHSAYLQNWWDTAVESVTHRGFEDLMGTVALLHAPLTAKDLVLISDEDELRGSNINVLLKQAARYIEGDDENGYGLHHRRIKQFVEDKLVDRIAVYRIRLADFCIKNWSDGQLSELGRNYALRYALVHLEAADRYKQAAGLMTAEWWATQWKHFSSYSGVIADLERILTAAAGRTEDQDAVCAAPALALAKEDARDIMKDLPVPILRAWVRLGMIDEVKKHMGSLPDYRAEARESLLGVAEELLTIAGEWDDMSLQELATHFLARVLGTLPLDLYWHSALEGLASTVQILSRFAVNDSGLRTLTAQVTAFAETREDILSRAAALACAARLSAKFSQTAARRLLNEAEETASGLTSSPDLLFFWSFALPAVRILEPNRVRDIVESNLSSLDRPPGGSSLAKDPLSWFLNRWSPISHGEEWAAPLISRLAGLYANVKEGSVSPAVFRLLAEFGQADRALEVLENLSLWNATISEWAHRQEMVKTLARLRRETVTEWLHRLTANPQIPPYQLASGFAAVGDWDRVVWQLRTAKPDFSNEHAFLECIEIASQIPDVKERRARVDALVESAGIFEPAGKKKIEAAAGLALLRGGPVEWNDHLRSAVQHSLAKRPGDSDTLSILMSVAYAQEGRFHESAEMAQRCRWLHTRVEAYTQSIRVALKQYPEVVHQLVEGIEKSFVSVPAETFLDSALLHACDAADLIVENFRDEAIRLRNLVGEWVNRGRAGLFPAAVVRIQVRLARIRTALDPSQGPNQARALVKSFDQGIESSCGELFEFLASVDPCEARDVLEGGRRLVELFKTPREQLPARADYAAALAKLDPLEAAALFEKTIHELRLWGREPRPDPSPELRMLEQRFGVPSDPVFMALTRIAGAIARAATALGQGFAPVLRETFAVALEVQDVWVREKAIIAFLRQAATTPADREQELCAVLTECLTELTGKLAAPLRDRALLEGVSALDKADLRRAAMVAALAIANPDQQAKAYESFNLRLRQVKHRRDWTEMSPLEEYFVSHREEDWRAGTLGCIRAGQIDLMLQVTLSALTKHRPRGRVAEAIANLVPLVCRKWGVDAARSLVDAIDVFERRWVEAAALIARRD